MSSQKDTIPKLHILLLDQGRQALPFLKSLKKSGHHITIVCTSKISEGYFSLYADRKLIWPNYTENLKGYENALLTYLSVHKPDVTIPLGDISASVIANNREQILQFTKVTIPPLEIFNLAADKGNTMMFCMENNIPCPKTFLPTEDSLGNILSNISFPVIMKPRHGNGAVGVTRFNTADDLINQYKKMNAAYGELLIQEFIPQENGMQFCAEVFMDADAQMKVCVVILKPRFFPIAGGTGTAYVTIERPDIEETVRQLLEGIKWTGPADVDFILDPRDQIPKVLEINPRVSACIKIAFAAGVDFANYTVDLALGLPIKKVVRYKQNVCLRNTVMESLWFISATGKMRRNTYPAFFSLKNVVEETFSWSDPFTMLGYILGLIRKYSSIKKLRRKFHK